MTTATGFLPTSPLVPCHHHLHSFRNPGSLRLWSRGYPQIQVSDSNDEAHQWIVEPHCRPSEPSTHWAPLLQPLQSQNDNLVHHPSSLCPFDTIRVTGAWHIGKYYISLGLALRCTTPGDNHCCFQPGQMLHGFGYLQHNGPTHLTFHAIPRQVCLPLHQTVCHTLQIGSYHISYARMFYCQAI